MHLPTRFGLVLSILLTLRLHQVLDKLDLILSVCTSIIQGGTDEDSSSDNMSSSKSEMRSCHQRGTRRVASLESFLVASRE
ncbi:unnamed protein product [Linum trigynum]|uniref:Secreted protein n=1 Tax=Linum trigynum TaxID=586398 RepID=A0AAV2EFP0_9ROSI